MNRRTLFITLASLAFGAASAATLELVEGAYEAVLSEVTFPRSAVGTLIVRMCDSCDPYSLRVEPSTVYVGTSGPTSRMEFLAEVEEIRNEGGAETTFVGVFYTLGTDRVTRVSLHPQ